MELIDVNKLYIPPEEINARMAVAYAPRVDAVPVVHCKNCKYWHYYGNGYHFCDIFLIANEFDSDSYDSCPDDFCSRGERGEDAEKTD